MRLQPVAVLRSRRSLGLPDVTGHVPLLTALAVDALGSGVWLPFSVLYFTITTPLSLAQVGLSLSITAGLALPAGPLLGTLVDRRGARPVLLAGNLLQALGVAGYLFVGGSGSLVIAATSVALGSQAFWAAYSPLVTQISRPGDRERWYGLLSALRNAGFGVGGLLSGVAVTSGSIAGYRAIAAINAGSFLLAVLLLLDRPRSGRAPAEPSRRALGPAAGGPCCPTARTSPSPQCTSRSRSTPSH
ncbi:MAG: MFS transporter [Actinomycetota bacterium]|nr:MFS transporter [Actinomycetota bacterium]